MQRVDRCSRVPRHYFSLSIVAGYRGDGAWKLAQVRVYVGRGEDGRPREDNRCKSNYRRIPGHANRRPVVPGNGCFRFLHLYVFPHVRARSHRGTFFFRDAGNRVGSSLIATYR